MSLSTQPYKGARDFYPEDKRIQKYMFGVLRSVVESFGYQEYDAPILEPFEIYAAKSGEEIVNEQLYSFEDRGGRKVAIRPEMTPTVSRMVAARRQELAYPLRLYSIPNLWRYERPQRGRLREHWQLNVDLFGVEGIEGDIEIIQIADSILKAFGAKPESYQIKVNSRNFIKQRTASAVPKNPDMSPNDLLKILDNWNKGKSGTRQKIESLFDKPEVIYEMMSSDQDESIITDNMKQILHTLKNIGVTSAIYDPTIARGLDYYTDIVFEVFDADPENNRSMFGGGRYDGLVAVFGVEPVPTVGFGMGDVTLQNFLESHKLLPGLKPETDAIVILIGDVYERAQPHIREMRKSGVNLAIDISGRKMDAQIKSAVKSGVRYAIFIGDKELTDNRFKLRDLEKGEEMELGLDEVVSTLRVRHSD